MITSMKTIIRCTEYITKTAKHHSGSARIGIPKKWANKEIIIIPIIQGITLRQQEKEYTIIVDSEIILKKEAKLKGTSAIAYLPLEYVDMDVLIIPIL